ncbi:M3 family metallopeptidase [Luteibacter sp. CQ10]|uniref:M3 family metallopeptidase n=1 Tax=Luteibacter sp. CQ10 TaxID=2805821 RepID=UPI0034A1F499
MKKTPLFAALVLIIATSSRAADYHIDPAPYFATPVAEAADLKALETDVAALASPAPLTPGSLLDYLRRAETLLSRAQRHAAYLHLRTALDIDDHEAADARSAAGSLQGDLMLKVRQTLRQLDDEAFREAEVAEPRLAHYAYVRDRATRGVPHELPSAEQTVLDALSDTSSDALWNTYQKTRRATRYGTVHTAHGDLDVAKDASALASDPDRDVRRQAWRQKQEADAAQAETYAAVLAGVVRLNDRTAKLQHFDDAPEAAYFSRLFDKADVHATATAVEAQADVLKDYQRLRAARVGKQQGIDAVHSWDMGATEPGFTAPTFDYDRLREMIPAALAPLGADYVAHFKSLLDPSTHRTDLAMAQGSRVNDAFSIAASGVPSGLFLGKWEHTARGASVVAHEGGHAIHSQLMNEHGVSPFYNHGPSWMHEGIAILNEMLFYEYLYRHAADAKTKAWYLQAQLDEMTLEIFTSAEEAQLEEAIYAGVMAGRIRKAADLDALTLDTTSRFEIWPSIDPELSHVWISKRLMYEDPLYLVNYLYAGLWAARMFDMATTDPADFRKRYDALMAEGFDAPPKALLRTFFGRDVSPGELVEADMALLRKKTNDLRQLYSEM